MARYLMSSRVGILKWLGALQVILGLLLFVMTLVYFAIDFEENSNNANQGSALYVLHVLFTIPTILLAMGAGVAGAQMSRYQGLVHNISAKNSGVALATMNGFAGLMTMIYSGSYIYFDIEETNVLDDDDTRSWQKAVIALIIINFILAFFDMLVAFAFVTLGILWMPSESVLEKASSLPPRLAPEPYMREPEPEIRDTYYRSGASRYPYSGGYYGSADPYYPGYRTLPALKY